MLDDPVGEALSGGTVYLRRGRRLRVDHFGESDVNGHILLSVEVSGSDFGFSHRAHHIAYGLDKVKSGTLGGRGEVGGFKGSGERELRK